MNRAPETANVSLASRVPKGVAIALVSADALLAVPAAAGECSPHCDYWHYYGPYDFSYVSPGLAGYPRCNREGNCSPYLTYVYPDRWYVRITVRPVRGPGPPSTAKGGN
jgi:hypothetical protein